MQEPPQIQPLPKKLVMVQIMFPCEDDKTAMDFKQKLNEVVKDIKDKRYKFEIHET